jgi:hypothetical protein
MLTSADAIPPCLWLYQHKGKWFSSKGRAAMTVFNCFVVVLGITIVSIFLPYRIWLGLLIANLDLVCVGYVVIWCGAQQRIRRRGLFMRE